MYLEIPITGYLEKRTPCKQHRTMALPSSFTTANDHIGVCLFLEHTAES